MRASMSSWMVPGISTVSGSPTSDHSPSVCTTTPSSTSDSAISSANAGLPSARVASLRASSGEIPPGSSACSSVAMRSFDSGGQSQPSHPRRPDQGDRLDGCGSGPRREHDHHPRGADASHEQDGEVDRRLVRPLEAVDEDRDRAFVRRVRQTPPECGSQVGQLGRVAASEDGLRDLLVGPVGHLLDERLEHVGDEAERPSADRVAAAAQHEHVVAQLGSDLVEQPCLAHPGVADHQGDRAVGTSPRAGRRGPQRRHLLVAADQRSVAACGLASPRRRRARARGGTPARAGPSPSSGTGPCR